MLVDRQQADKRLAANAGAHASPCAGAGGGWRSTRGGWRIRRPPWRSPGRAWRRTTGCVANPIPAWRHRTHECGVVKRVRGEEDAKVGEYVRHTGVVVSQYGEF